MDLYKDSIIYKIFKKLIYFSVSVFVISIYVFFNHSSVYASSYARCNLQISSNTYFATAQIVIKTANGAPLPSNLFIHAYTNSCSNGFDNGSFLTGNPDAQNWGISTSTSPFSVQSNFTYAQLKANYPSASNPPTLYQNFGTINVGSSSTVDALCPVGFGCNANTNPNSSYSGYYEVLLNSNQSTAVLTFYQVIDCGYSYLNYFFKPQGIPTGWTVNGKPIGTGFTGQIPVANSLTVPAIPALVLTPPVPTITISQSCPNASGSTGGITWTLTDYYAQYELQGYLIDTSTGNHLYGFSEFSPVNATSGSYSGFFSSVSGTNKSYSAFMQIDFYPPGSGGTDPTATAGPFDYYTQCSGGSSTTTPNPPTMTVSLDCSFHWNVTSNFQLGDTITGVIKNSSGTTVANLSNEYTQSGSDNTFLSSLDSNNQSYYASVDLAYGSGQNLYEKTNSYNFYTNCKETGNIPPPSTPSITARLSCAGLKYYISGFQSGDSVDASINPVSGKFAVAYMPTQYVDHYVYSTFVKSLETKNQSYYSEVVLHFGSHNLYQKTNSFNFDTSKCASIPITSGSPGSGSSSTSPPPSVCGLNSLLNCPTPGPPTTTGTTLTIDGSIVGYGGVYSFRDLGGEDLTTPAVSIVFNPNFLSIYNELFISNLGSIIQYWIEPGI